MYKKNHWWQDDLGMMKLQYFVAAGLIGLTLLTVGVVGLCAWVNSNECAYQSQKYGHQTKYHWPYGCFIKTSDGTWLSIDKYQGYKSVK